MAMSARSSDAHIYERTFGWLVGWLVVGRLGARRLPLTRMSAAVRHRSVDDEMSSY